MRTLALAALLASTAGFAQMVVGPASLPAVANQFTARGGEKRLACWVDPLKARLNFSLRFQSGYVFHVPLKQYFGPGHAWIVLTRITPQDGEHQPVHLIAGYKLPNIPKTNENAALGGGYSLGEGSYQVDWMLVDEAGRVCRAHWRTEASLRRDEAKVKLRITPNTVRELYGAVAPQTTPASGERPVRLTVLLHASPYAVFRGPQLRLLAPSLRIGDRMRLLGSLAAMLDSLPPVSLRLVAFNLEQQKELFRCDSCPADVIQQLAQALNQVELGVVDRHVLENRRGHLDLLAELIQRELGREPRSDAVVFLGPTARFAEKVPALEEPHAAAPQFFYFQYKPYWDRGADFPDSIEHAVVKLRGKTTRIHTPGEFAAAIDELQKRVAAR